MKFKAYLNEGRTKSISFDMAVKLAVDNCKKNIKKLYQNNKGINIWRGIPESYNTGYINTNVGKRRKSANTLNYLTLLIDNLPTWKSFPKRSRGMICSTDIRYSSQYGEVYHVIPYDNSLIGVCPDEDIFYSFKKVFGDDVVRQFVNWIDSIINKKGLDFSDTSFTKLKKNLKTLDMIYKSEYEEYPDLYKDRDINFSSPGRYGLFDPNKDIMDTLNKKLSPEANGFRLGIKNLKHNREVWIQGESLIISMSYINDFLQEYENEI